MDLVEVELSRVVLQEKGDNQFIHLRERGNGRTMTIVIGWNEATEINRKLCDQPTQRPLTHDLIGRILATVGWRLARVVVNELRENTFFALLVLVDGDGNERTVDCRPSDAVALAVQFHAQLFVARDVMEAAGQS
jgi:bifunctional DNase/RNase